MSLDLCWIIRAIDENGASKYPTFHALSILPLGSQIPTRATNREEKSEAEEEWQKQVTSTTRKSSVRMIRA